MATAPLPIKKPLSAALSAPPKPPRRQPDNLIQLQEQFAAVWMTKVAPDVLLEDVLRPEFLGLRARRLRVGDEVIILHPDWMLKTVIVKTDEITHCAWHIPQPGWPLMLKGATLAAADLRNARIDQTAAGYRCLHGHDVLVDGLGTEEDARAWLEKKKAELS